MAPSSGGKKLRQRRERRQAFTPGVPKARKREIGRSTTRETPLHLRAHGTRLDGSLSDYIRGRMSFKLGKFGLRLTRVSVRIQSVAAPPGAPVYTCKLKVVLVNAQHVVVSASEANPRVAFDMAADATERAVRRLLGRRETRRYYP